METVRDEISKVITLLPHIAISLADKIASEIGVEDLKDLALVTEEDLLRTEILYLIQARKLVNAWKTPEEKGANRVIFCAAFFLWITIETMDWMDDSVDLQEKMSSIQPAPIVLVVGGSLISATNFSVAIVGNIAMRCTEFFTALVYAFCSFYVFDMKYPDGSLLTYEFIQRYFAGINTPGVRSSKKLKYGLHPKVMKLSQLVESV